MIYSLVPSIPPLSHNMVNDDVLKVNADVAVRCTIKFGDHFGLTKNANKPLTEGDEGEGVF